MSVEPPSTAFSTRRRISRLILILSMLVMGACGIIYEYVLSLQGSYLMGAQQEQIFVIIGVMLFAMGVGSMFQSRLLENLLSTFILLEILLGLLGGVSAFAIYSAFIHWEVYPVILFGFAFVIGALIGMEMPVLIRINREYSHSLRVNLSEIFSVDYIGSLLGALLFTYVLLSHLSLARIGFMMGMVNTTLAVVALFWFGPLVRHRFSLFALATLSFLLLVAGFVKTDGWVRDLEQKYYQDPIVHNETTRYQHIVLTRRNDVIRLYLNGNLQFSSQDEAIYHDYLVHMPMVLAPSRRRVLILGGGDGLALREILKYGDVEEVTLVDIDPAVTRLARENPLLAKLNHGSLRDDRVDLERAGGITEGEEVTLLDRSRRETKRFTGELHATAKIRLFHVDAARFIREKGEPFDVAILDFPDPSTPELSKLFSLDLYRSLRRRLTPESILSVQSSSPFFAKNAYLSVGMTLQAAGFQTLPYQATVPSFAGYWGFWLAWKGPVTPARQRERIRSLSSLPVESRYVTPPLLAASLLFGKGALTPTREIRANTMMDPVLFRYYRESWNKND